MRSVLYVDRCYSCTRPDPGDEAVGDLLAALRTRFRVDFRLGLTPDVLDAVREGEYDALVTHFPYYHQDALGVPLGCRTGVLRALYQRSHDLLGTIKGTCPETPIIVYTGADLKSDVGKMVREVSDEAVAKSDHPEHDARLIARLILSREAAVPVLN
jgi:DNA-binding transcriptional LysR family regulator